MIDGYDLKIAPTFHFLVPSGSPLIELKFHGQSETALVKMPRVPERREEVTTEGGLDIVGQVDRIAAVVDQLQDIDHTIESRAALVGMERAVREMKQAMRGEL